jgi:uncharacterized protein (TIGR02271 family)
MTAVGERAMQDEPSETISVVEEQATVDKVDRTSRVRVRTETETHDTTASAELQGVELEITRVPMNREVASMPEVRTEGDVTVLPVVEEVLVVEKRLFLKEEVHVRHRKTNETVEVPVTLRRQNAVVERLDGTTTGASAVEPTNATTPKD